MKLEMRRIAYKQTNLTNTVAINVTRTVSLNSDQKKVIYKMNC